MPDVSPVTGGSAQKYMKNWTHPFFSHPLSGFVRTGFCREWALVMLVFFYPFFSRAALAPNGEVYVDEPFFEDFEGSSVNTQVWQVATWAEHGGRTGTDRCFVRDGNLHMQFINSSTEGFLSSAIQTRSEFFFGTWEFRAKPSDVSGILNSFYTIDWNNTADASSSSDGTKEEIDIEFLTKSFIGDSGQVHFALHASGKTSWDTRPDIDLGFNPSSGFHIYGFRITPTFIDWTVDGVVMHRYSYEGNPIAITSPYQLKLNVWSAVQWVGGPPTPDVVADYQIDWIRFTPYRPNQAPVLDSIGPHSTSAGSALEISVSGTDPDEDSLQYSSTGTE